MGLLLYGCSMFSFQMFKLFKRFFFLLLTKLLGNGPLIISKSFNLPITRPIWMRALEIMRDFSTSSFSNWHFHSVYAGTISWAPLKAKSSVMLRPLSAKKHLPVIVCQESQNRMWFVCHSKVLPNNTEHLILHSKTPLVTGTYLFLANTQVLPKWNKGHLTMHEICWSLMTGWYWINRPGQSWQGSFLI